MFKRKCPCCHEMISVKDFFKGFPKETKGDIKCIKCTNVLLPERFLTNSIVIQFIVTGIILALPALSETYFGVTDIVSFSLKLASAYAIFLFSLLIVNFHKLVSLNFKCS